MSSVQDSSPFDANNGFPYNESDFIAISTAVKDETGIHLTSGKATLVYSRLSKRLRKLGISRFEDYCNFVNCDEGAEERQNMINALTTNVTSFYREAHHFEDFRNRVLPNLIEKAKKGARIRIWSAACSSGEEPYSIAMEILSKEPAAHSYDIKILATDIDPVILNKGQVGRYLFSVVNKLPDEVVSRFFTQDGSDSGTLFVKDVVKEIVSFRSLNLIGHWPVSGPFDVVFCRNVTIYFDPPTRDKIWEKFSTVIPLGGQLYVGHSERISGAASSMFLNNGVTAYSRSDVAAGFS